MPIKDLTAYRINKYCILAEFTDYHNKQEQNNILLKGMYNMATEIRKNT